MHSRHCLRVTSCLIGLTSCPIVIFLCFPVTRPAASSIKKVVGILFTENNTGGQLDTQNDDPTAGKGQENGSKGIEQPQIQDDQEQDVVDDDSGEDGQDLIEGRERKVQNHAYQWEEGSGNASCIGFVEDEKLLKSGWNFSRYPWRIVGKFLPRARRRSVLYGTAYAQQVIWQHQNPSDCSNAKFLEYRHMRSGIGSQLHLLGQALALAMHLGRILVLPKKDSEMRYHDKSFCPGEYNWHCWFQPITWCEKGGDVVKVSGLPELNKTDFHTRAIPEIFHPLLECSPIKNRTRFYWWRAQSIAYLIRFNGRTRKAVDHLRSESLMQCKEKVTEKLLPPGSISAHVRHGFKFWEAKIYPFEDYEKLMEQLASGNQHLPILHKEFADGNASFTYEPHLYSKRNVFISTEDPKVIEQALKLCDRWKVMYTKHKRTNDDRWMKMSTDADARREVLTALMNLELALEADGWICTLLSNWCRLIDELRQTVAMKAGRPYFSLSKSSRHATRKGLTPPKNSYLDW